jgi:hypothetical protein
VEGDLWTPSGTPLRNYVSAVVVYENGKLVAAWDKTSVSSEFAIPRQALVGSNLPFEAPIDIQLIPAHVEVDPVKLRTELGSWRVDQLKRVGAQSAAAAMMTGQTTRDVFNFGPQWKQRGCFVPSARAAPRLRSWALHKPQSRRVKRWHDSCPQCAWQGCIFTVELPRKGAAGAHAPG